MARQRESAEILPEDTQSRFRLIVEQSAPDLERPLLSPEIENALNETERKSAACYAGIEEATFRFHQIARKLREKP